MEIVLKIIIGAALFTYGSTFWRKSIPVICAIGALFLVWNPVSAITGRIESFEAASVIIWIVISLTASIAYATASHDRPERIISFAIVCMISHYYFSRFFVPGAEFAAWGLSVSVSYILQSLRICNPFMCWVMIASTFDPTPPVSFLLFLGLYLIHRKIQHYFEQTAGKNFLAKEAEIFHRTFAKSVFTP